MLGGRPNRHCSSRSRTLSKSGSRLMVMLLRYNTESQEVLLGRFVDSVDGNTEETGLTIANTDVKLWKNGATTMASKNSGGGTPISNGLYYAVLDATDTNTKGPMRIDVHVTGALPVAVWCWVVEQAIFDALFASGNLPVDLKAQSITPNVSVAAMSAATIAASTFAADAVNAAALATDAVTEISNAVRDLLAAADRRGTAKAGASTTITLDAGASSTSSIYNGALMGLLKGTGADTVAFQKTLRKITACN